MRGDIELMGGSPSHSPTRENPVVCVQFFSILPSTPDFNYCSHGYTANLSHHTLRTLTRNANEKIETSTAE